VKPLNILARTLVALGLLTTALTIGTQIVTALAKPAEAPTGANGPNFAGILAILAGIRIFRALSTKPELFEEKFKTRARLKGEAEILCVIALINFGYSVGLILGWIEGGGLCGDRLRFYFVNRAGRKSD
jgi:hypothetical protein